MFEQSFTVNGRLLDLYSFIRVRQMSIAGRVSVHKSALGLRRTESWSLRAFAGEYDVRLLSRLTYELIQMLGLSPRHEVILKPYNAVV